MSQTFNYLWGQFLSALPELIVALVILLGSIYLAKFVNRILEEALKRRKVGVEITALLTMTARWAIVTLGILTALQRFFDVTAFLAGLGIIGFSIGFALQDILKNFAAGVILLLQQPFKVGDSIEIGNYSGVVQTINVRTTELRTFDGRLVIIPNADLLANIIVNLTRADKRRIDLSISVDYNSNLQQVHEALLNAIRVVPGYLPDPAPLVVSETFGESAINLKAYFWIDLEATNLFNARDAALKSIKEEFESRGIRIPNPITTVILHTA
ncbi:MAG: mechanosensitive ion channel [Anaerolineales bacterium]|nr:mechanosensitive ion channel [Anaerolineales bacterium]MDW8447265.1 mechanosensitive ion channel [Anaerolineales bacterium]